MRLPVDELPPRAAAQAVGGDGGGDGVRRRHMRSSARGGVRAWRVCSPIQTRARAITEKIVRIGQPTRQQLNSTGPHEFFIANADRGS